MSESGPPRRAEDTENFLRGYEEGCASYRPVVEEAMDDLAGAAYALADAEGVLRRIANGCASCTTLRDSGHTTGCPYYPKPPDLEDVAASRRLDRLEAVAAAARTVVMMKGQSGLYTLDLTLSALDILTEGAVPGEPKDPRPIHEVIKEIGDKYPSEPSGIAGQVESFEEWHRRECPTMHLSGLGGCGGHDRWQSFNGDAACKFSPKFLGRTCREAYAKDTPPTPAPSPGEVERAARELAEAALDASGPSFTGERTTRFYLALAKYRSAKSAAAGKGE